MRIRRRVILAALSATVGLWVLSGAAGAADGDIQCGSVITEDTVLAYDLLDCENGLVVAAPNVTLDLGSHQIVGRGTGTGVHFVYEQSAGSVVRNGAIRAFGTGVFFQSSANVSRLDISEMVGAGIVSYAPGSAPPPTNVVIEKSTLHHNGGGIFGGAVGNPCRPCKPEIRIIDNRILNNQGDGIDAFRWYPLLIQGNLISDNGGSGVNLNQSHAVILDNTFHQNVGRGLVISDWGHDSFFRIGANLARANGGLGLSFNEGCAWCVPGPLLDAGGNAASRNGDPQECTPNLVCARNRGQADKLAPLTAEQAEARHDEN